MDEHVIWQASVLFCCCCFPVACRVASSAYMSKYVSGRSFINKRNSTCPRTESCGTQLLTVWSDDFGVLVYDTLLSVCKIWRYLALRCGINYTLQGFEETLYDQQHQMICVKGKILPLQYFLYQCYSTIYQSGVLMLYFENLTVTYVAKYIYSDMKTGLEVFCSKLQYVSSGFCCRVITGSLMRFY